MARQLKDGRWQIKYPSHRDSKNKIVYRQKSMWSKRKVKEFKTKQTAEFEKREAHGIPHDPKLRKEYTVKELLTWYLEHPDVMALKDRRNMISRSKRLIEYFGDAKVSSLLPENISLYRQYRQQYVGDATVNREVALFKACCNKGVVNQKLKRNPCVGVRSFKEDQRDRVVSKDEFELLKANLNEDARGVITIAYYTGMRLSEIMDLEWNRIDMRAGYISLRAEDTKNGEPRKVPFMKNEEVIDLLKRRRKIFGRVFDVKSIRKNFETVREKLGIKDLRVHDFRHTAATNMRKAGIDTTIVMKICGWKSVAMFLRYNNVDDSDLEQASEALARFEEKRLTRGSVSG